MMKVQAKKPGKSIKQLSKYQESFHIDIVKFDREEKFILIFHMNCGKREESSTFSLVL